MYNKETFVCWCFKNDVAVQTSSGACESDQCCVTRNATTTAINVPEVAVDLRKCLRVTSTCDYTSFQQMQRQNWVLNCQDFHLLCQIWAMVT